MYTPGSKGMEIGMALFLHLVTHSETIFILFHKTLDIDSLEDFLSFLFALFSNSFIEV